MMNKQLVLKKANKKSEPDVFIWDVDWVLHEIENAVCVIGEDFKIKYSNSSFHKEFGNHENSRCYEFFGGLEDICKRCRNGERTYKEIARWEWKSRQNGKTYVIIEIPVKTRNNGWAMVKILRDISEFKETAKELKAIREQLIVEQVALQTKNATLREMLNQIETEKKYFGHLVQSNIDRLIMPLINKLEPHLPPEMSDDFVRLTEYITEATSPFINKLERQYDCLTPRELETCKMIKCGLTSKEIAKSMNISVETVRFQRKNIRRKLGIANQKQNLSSFLQII